jgi:soluble lytic murein transglycosylase-like protein/TolA-binding protein
MPCPSPYAAVLILCACLAASASAALPYVQASPQLPAAMSWSGTRELTAGSVDAALLAVKSDTYSPDTQLRLFKLGALNARQRNNVEAVSAFNAVNKGSAALAPLAMEQIGDIAVAEREDVKAMSAYSSALKAQGLPVKYRHYLFAKVRPLAGRGVPLPAGAPWAEEYRKWDRARRMFDAAGLEFICDSLAAAGLVAEADSLLERHLPELNKREACGVVDRMFRKRSSDSTLTTKFLFSLASQSHDCRSLVTAERFLDQAQKRADFAAAVPARKAALLAAQIAFGREQWQKAADLYKKYDAAYGPESDVIMSAARAYRNLGNAEQAQKWYELHVKHFPSHAKTQEILWLRAWNQEEQGNYKAAAAGYARIFNTKGKRTEEAYMRHALCYYRRQEYDSAIVHLTSFQKKFPQSSYLWSSMFWQGKCLIALKKTDEAHKIWGSIIKLDPTDYHAHRAAQLMGPAAVAPAVSASPLAAQMPENQARKWLESISPSSSKKALTAQDSVDLRRGAALLSVCRTDIADFFLENFESNYSGNLLLQYDLAIAYALAGNEARSFRVSRRLAWRIPMDRRERMPLQVLSIIFPPFYAPTITKHAERFNVDPLLVSSVMRQESIFDAKIVSPAGAIGLMQVMPATGKNIASELKEPFTDDSLYNYDYNIRFGTFYLRKRLTQFSGDHVLVLCSYNAGAHNAIKWRDKNRKLEHDLFVEDIGFYETRGYVKKVMGNYWTYKALAETPGYEYDLPDFLDPYPWVNEW